MENFISVKCMYFCAGARTHTHTEHENIRKGFYLMKVRNGRVFSTCLRHFHSSLSLCMRRACVCVRERECALHHTTSLTLRPSPSPPRQFVDSIVSFERPKGFVIGGGLNAQSTRVLYGNIYHTLHTYT